MTAMPRIVVGYLSFIMYVMMAYYIYKIIKNIRKDPETSLSMFFLQNTPQKAFKVYAISTFLLTASLTVEIYAFIFEMSTVADIAILFVALHPIGFLYFYQKIYGATSRVEEQ